MARAGSRVVSTMSSEAWLDPKASLEALGVFKDILFVANPQEHTRELTEREVIA